MYSELLNRFAAWEDIQFLSRPRAQDLATAKDNLEAMGLMLPSDYLAAIQEIGAFVWNGFTLYGISPAAQENDIVQVNTEAPERMLYSNILIVGRTENHVYFYNLDTQAYGRLHAGLSSIDEAAHYTNLSEVLEGALRPRAGDIGSRANPAQPKKHNP